MTDMPSTSSQKNIWLTALEMQALEAEKAADQIAGAQSYARLPLFVFSFDIERQTTALIEYLDVKATLGPSSAVAPHVVAMYIDSIKHLQETIKQMEPRDVYNLYDLTDEDVVTCMHQWKIDGHSASTLSTRYSCLMRLMACLDEDTYSKRIEALLAASSLMGYGDTKFIAESAPHDGGTS